MNFSPAATIRRLIRPRHELSCPAALWERLLATLRERGGNGAHESGAFLLAEADASSSPARSRASSSGRTSRVSTSGRPPRMVRFVPYDDLDPRCFDTGIVRFDGRHYGALWDLCRREHLRVAADVHTHPGSEHQSESDRAHPMIAAAGHIALIVPRFAMLPVRRVHVGMYRYLGAGQWESIPRHRRRDFLHIGF